MNVAHTSARPILHTLLASLLALGFAAALGAASLGTAFTYQGVLEDGGVPADGSFDFVFRLYDDATAGSQVGSDVSLTGVTVADGLFTVELDFGSVFDGTALWLEIEVGGTTLGLRQNLTPTPFALYAASGSSLSQTPGDPVLVGSLGLGANPAAISVSGRYAYVVNSTDLEVIDVTEPGSPTMVGSATVGSGVDSLFVSGRYAYVGDADGVLVVDVSDPSAPTVAGSVSLGTGAASVFVSGRYAYAVTDDGKLRVVDVSDPANPTQVGILGIGSQPTHVHVAGAYAYVLDAFSQDLKVIDVSDPRSPTLAGSLGSLEAGGVSLTVSGRYAYVSLTGRFANELLVVDVSDPSAPTRSGSLSLGRPWEVVVSGRYAYVGDQGTGTLEVIDVSDPGAPTSAASLSIGSAPTSVSVAGRYAYVVDSSSDDLKVIDISGSEVTSMIAHSLEAGSLQVRESLSVQGQLSVASGLDVGAGGVFSDGDVGISGTLALANDVVPTSSPAGLVQLYAEDVGGTSELKVRDEAGNVTTLSPHNFSLVGGPSEPLAWAYYSHNDHGTINVDMLRTVRLVEQVTGETLVHTRDGTGSDVVDLAALEGLLPRLVERVEDLESQNEALRTELALIKAALGLDREEPSP